MSRRVLDVSIRSEFRKGFGDIARAMSSLESKLANVSKLTDSINKLATKMDSALALRQAQAGTKKVEAGQKSVNKALSEGERIAKRYESAHTALGNKLASVASAQRAGHVNNKQRLQAEIGLLKEYIKKTGDLSVLQNKNGYRDNKGRFVAFTKDALNTVSNGLSTAIDTGIKRGSRRGAETLVAQMKATSSRIKGAVERITASGYQPSFNNRNAQANFYEAAWGSQGRRPGAGLATQQLINRNTGVRPVNEQTGLMLGSDSKFNQLKLHYQSLEQKAATTSKRISGYNFGPNPARSEAGFKRLFDSYNRIGHFLFQLQYSTMTIFGLSGIGMILGQADAYTTLQNQVARTSVSINDLGENMEAVFDIANRSFSDAKAVGQLYSTINKYSKALELSKDQVKDVVGGIAGAFAASPGAAEAKKAAQYQFIQAIQSNRLGGDELRSILEQAPFVGDVLARGVAQVRGRPEGEVVNLRDKKNPPTTQEIVKALQLPNIQKMIFDTLSGQARTFGDVGMLFKNRLLEMTHSFENATGIFGNVVRGLAAFVNNDDQWTKFTNAITAATTALVIYAGMLGAQVASAGVGKLTRGIGARLGLGRQGVFSETAMQMGPNGVFASATRGQNAAGQNIFGRGMSNAAVNAMYADARRENISRTLAPVGAALRGGVSAVGSGASTAITAVGAALLALKNPTKVAADGFKAAASGISGSTRVVRSSLQGMSASIGNVASKGKLGSSILNGLKSAIGFLIAPLMAVIGALGVFTVPLIVIATIVALLAMRFNKLLGSMAGGMNIMDILMGLWDKLGRAMSWIGRKIDELSGGLFSGLGGAIDAVLKMLGRAAAADADFQNRRDIRQFGGVDGIPVIHVQGRGNFVATRGADGKLTSTGREARNADGTWRRADFNAGETGIRAFANRDLAAGMQSPLAPTANSGGSGNSGPKDPWPEFIRDLRLKIQNITDLRDVAPQFHEMRSQMNENLRRAMDVMNFDSSKFDTLAEAWDEFSKTHEAKAKDVNDWNVKLRSEKMIEAMRNFINTITDSMIEAQSEFATAGLGELARAFYDNRKTAITEFLESPKFGLPGQSEADVNYERIAIRDSLANGRIDNAETRLRNNINPDDRGEYETYLADRNSLKVGSKARELGAENRRSQALLDTQIALMGVYGRQRDFREQILNLEAEQAELTRGVTGEILDEINQKYAERIAIIQNTMALESRQRADWRLGFGQAIEEYGDGLKDVAGQTKDIFSNALKGLEDSLVSMITTADLKMDDVRQGLSDLLKSIQADVARMFVKQFIMKPINSMIQGIGERLFGMKDADQTINAQNVYINGALMGGVSAGNMLGGLKGGFGSFAQQIFGAGNNTMGKIGQGISTLTNFLPPPFNMLGKLFSMFHEGGTVGQSSMSRVVNPSVFRGAMRYHTGTNFAGMPALAVNEVPAILKQGEKVLTASQYSAMNSGSGGTTFAPNISVNYTSNGSSSDGNEGGPDHAKSVGMMVKAAVNEAIMDYDARSRRPGSPGYLANRR